MRSVTVYDQQRQNVTLQPRKVVPNRIHPGSCRDFLALFSIMVMNSSIRSSLISASTMTENGFSDILTFTVLANVLVATIEVLAAREVALLILKAFEDRSKKRQEAESSFILSCVSYQRQQTSKGKMKCSLLVDSLLRER